MKKIMDDWAANHEWKSRFVLFFFRIAHGFAVRKGRNNLVWIIGLPVLILYRLSVEWLLNVEIPAKTQIGPGLKLRHGQGLVIHPGTKIGPNVTLRHNTTIGNKKGRNGVSTASPVIEEGADIGCNVVLIGPITVGRGAVIGAGAVVTKDVPASAVAVGNPAVIRGAMDAEISKDKVENS